MFCPKCGNSLPDGASFCNKCGAKLENARVAAKQGSSTTSVSSPSSVAQQAVASASSTRPSLQGVRVAAVVLVVAMLLTAFMPWFEPDGALRAAGGAVSGLAELFGGGSASSDSFDESYGLWQMFSLIGEGQQFASYMGSSSLGTYFLLFWIPFALSVLAAVLGIVGIAKTFGRTGGKGALVGAAALMLLACLAFWFINLMFYHGGYAESMLPSGPIAGLVFSVVALIAAAASRGKAKEHKAAEDGSAS